MITECLGYDLAYRRRRYSNRTFTWVFVAFSGRLVSLGDPWPCVRPKRSEIEREVRRVIGAPALGSVCCALNNQSV